jgi:hypothetical protein
VNFGIAYTPRGCAASRTMVFLAQPGGTERRVPGSPAYFHSERGEGTAACRERGGQPKTCRWTHRKTRTIRVRLDCLKPNLRSGRLVPHRDHVWKRCHSVQGYRLATLATSRLWAVTDEVKEGDEWVPYVELERTMVTKRGIAFLP